MHLVIPLRLTHTTPGSVLECLADDDAVGFSVGDFRVIGDAVGLTPREMDVCALLLCDLAPKEIAKLLELRTSYVRVTQRRIQLRLQVRGGRIGLRRRAAQIASARFNHGKTK